VSTVSAAGEQDAHEFIDTGTQPYACEFCEKRFARSDVRNRHMQLSHKELYSNWLASLPPGRTRNGSKQVDEDVMETVEEGEENSVGGLDDLDDDEFRMQRDRSPVAQGSGFDMEIDLGEQDADRPERHGSTSHNRTTSAQRPSFQYDMDERDLRERVLKQHEVSLAGPSNAPRQPYFVPPELAIRDQRESTHRGVSTTNPERNSDNPYMDPELSRSIYNPQHRSAAEPYQSQSLAERDLHLRREAQRDLMSHRLEDGDANRAQGEIFSRLDILVAAAAEPENGQRNSQQADARISGASFMSEHEVPIPPQRITETGGSYSESLR
jgi:hypothetical protein